MVSCISTLITFVLLLGSSVRVLKAATFNMNSVNPWKWQNSMADIFQCIFEKISEHVFCRTTVNCYFGTKGVNIAHQLFCLSHELLQIRPKLKCSKFFYKFLLGIIFGGLCLKNAFDQEKVTQIWGETKRCSAKMLVGKVVPWVITEELTFVNRTAV